MSVLSKLGTAALLVGAGICFATTAAIVYFLTKEETFHEERSYDPVQSSRYSVIEVTVPSELIGGVIGRSGANIARIQEATHTRINFRDQVVGEEVRIAVIRGKPMNAQAAEKLLRQEIAQRRSVITEEVRIPTSACGKVIGKNGTNIRMICDVSHAKVSVERTYNRSDFRTVTIKGTSSEIETAKGLIDELLAEREAFPPAKPIEISTANRQWDLKGKQLCITETEDSRSVTSLTTEKLEATARDGFLGVFVSSVQSPSRFWVQPVGVRAVELDKLVKNMTAFYSDKANATEHAVSDPVEVGALVAVPFSFDDDWYRGRVVSIAEDEYDPMDSTVSVYYVDFGDCFDFRLKELCKLRDEFVQLAFQAVECCLDRVEPCGGGDKWSPEAVSHFEQLTYNALWKEIMLKITAEDGQAKRVTLVDTGHSTSDVDIAKELVASQFAQWVVDDKD